jgi:hypothetical protein
VSDKHVLLSVLFFQEPENPDLWIAQALEYDIAAYGPDIAAAKHAFTRTLEGHVLLAERQNREPFSGLKRAPDVFWTVWRNLIDAKEPPAMEPLKPSPAMMIPVVSHDPVATSH